MALTDQDIEKISAMMRKFENRTPVEKAFDIVQKAAVSLLVAAVLWVSTSIAGMKTQMAVIIEKVERFEQFTDRPRFTHEDYEQNVAPLNQTVRLHSEMLARRTDWMDRTDDRLAKIERDLALLNAEHVDHE